MSETISPITFVPFTTFVDPTFWSEVNERKVVDWQLSCDAHEVTATYSACGKQPNGASLCISRDAFTVSLQDGETMAATAFDRYFTSHVVDGHFLLTNTKKMFVEKLDRRNILEQGAKRLWEVIESRRWLDDPDLLNYFYFTAFADIKQFEYYYWNCVPALLHPAQIVETATVQQPDDAELQVAVEFLRQKAGRPPSAFVLRRQTAGEAPTAHSLAVLMDQEHGDKNEVTLVFVNPSSVWGKPSWTLRNLLAAVAHLRPYWRRLRVLALRRVPAECFVLHIGWAATPAGDASAPLKCVGWERDAKTGTQTYRHVELKSMFDPIQIMEQTADLNLRLIRWQQAPNIQLERLTELRVLIVGSGTLGCNLSRGLLGWGVRRFTFVDHANVSYNNPIRQSLFTFEDCQRENGAFNKAAAAAASLRRIFPRVDASAVDMKIPMPGHPYSVDEKSKIRQVCEELDTLIATHDVIFLVMDSRESRWLPTLIASHHNKLTLTVALGFDSFVVMRHGASAADPIAETKGPHGLSPNTVVPGESLGCYFCSDVTAPGNSTADRTLDQQCTISRAGVSMVASGLAVELVSSVLQHELGRGAPALLGNVDETAGVLGATPHQIRGFFSRFQQMTPTVRRFAQCTACGVEVRRLYADWREASAAGDGADANSYFDDFLHAVFQNSAALEQLSGLTALQASVDQLQLSMLELDDD